MNSAPDALLDANASSDAVLTWARTAGAPGALAILAHALAFEADNANSREFVEAFNAALVPGDHLERAAHRWVLWGWDSAARPLNARITGPASRLAAEGVIELHGRAAGGGQIDSRTWRLARRAINDVNVTLGAEKQALAVVAAAAWDFATVPGAAPDMLTAWQSMIRADCEDADGWTPALDTEATKLVAKMRTDAQSAAGDPPKQDDAQATAAYQRAANEIFVERLANDPPPLVARRMAMLRKAIDAMLCLRQEGRAALLALLREPK